MKKLNDDKLYEIKNTSLLLNLLVTDVQAFNAYREKFPYQEINLSNFHMKEVNLSYANLSYANLSYANLIGAELDIANIGHANFKDTRLYNARITLTRENLEAIKLCKL